MSHSEPLHVLTLNTGSSSIKFSIYQENQLYYQGQLSALFSEESRWSVTDHEGTLLINKRIEVDDYRSAFALIIQWMEQLDQPLAIDVIAHRIVHGGSTFSQPTLIDDEVLVKLQEVVPFDPLHMKSELLGVVCCREGFPQAKQIACFDTAFHHTLPPVAYTLPIPIEFQNKGIRRYGFHGLSYEYVLYALNEHFPEEANGSIVIAHLGSGASVAAVKEGKCVDTTMGFTSISGIMMSTRTGDIDPGVITYLQSTYEYSPEDIQKLISQESGLKGTSGISGDMKELLKLQNAHPSAALAVDMFCYQLSKMIGSYITVLGGIDTLVFTGGIGENAAEIRERICERLGLFGITCDRNLNRQHSICISDPENSIHVRVMKTNEELMLSRHAQQGMHHLVR